jgi:hypothetical protein
MMLWFAIAYGAASLFWTTGRPSNVPAFLDQGAVLEAMRVVFVGVLAFLIGYQLRLRATSNRASPRTHRLFGYWTPRHALRDAWLLFLVGTVATAIQIASGTFGYLQSSNVLTEASPLSNVLHLLSQLAYFGIFLMSFATTRHFSISNLLSLILVVLLASAISLFSGVKESFILVGLALIFGYAAERQRLPLLGMFATILIFLFFIAPFTSAYRDRVNIRPQERLDTVAAIGQLVPALESMFQAHGDQHATGGLLEGRIPRINDVAVVTKQTPSQIGFRSALEFLEAPILGLVPRAVWPTKPILTTGYDFSVQYYHNPTTEFSSPAITPYADLWRHGGWLPLLVGMASFGIILRLLDDSMARGQDARRFFFFLLIFALVVKQEDDIIGLIAAVPGLFLATWLAARLIARREGRDVKPTVVRQLGEQGSRG